jgi:Protein of unknown function (DUF4239)
MGDWLLNLPVLAMGAVILALTFLGTAVIYRVVTWLAENERNRAAFKAISPGMLPPLSVVFALLVGFLAAQVWSDSERANSAVNREASALRDAILVAGALPPDTELQFRQLIRAYILNTTTREWPAMARGDVTLTLAPPRLTEALQLALSFPATSPGQQAAQRSLATSLQAVFDLRRERIILSRSSVNWVKWAVLLGQAGIMMVAIAMVHCDNRLTNKIILGIFATSVAVAVVLVAAHSRPFTGQISVRPTYLLQIMPESGMARR